MRIFKLALVIGLTIFCLNKVALSAIDPSITLQFTFDEGSGNKATDISEHGNDGVIHGAAWVNGKYGQALEFDGESAYVEVSSNTTLNFTDAMTLMAWIYKSEFLSRGETIISKKQGGAYSLEVTGWENRFPEKLTSEPRISGTYQPVESPDPLPLNRWVHVAVTYDGDLVRLYVDGEMVIEESFPGTIDVNSANLYVGNESDGNQPDASHGAFKGVIDEVIAANRAFSADEIKSQMEFASVEPKGKLATNWGSIKALRQKISEVRKIENSQLLFADIYPVYVYQCKRESAGELGYSFLV